METNDYIASKAQSEKSFSRDKNMLEEESLIKRVKTSFGLIFIMLITILVIVVNFLISFVIIRGLLILIMLFVAILSSIAITLIYFVYFWKHCFSTKLDNSDKNAIIEIIKNYRKKVKPCIFIAIISVICSFLSEIFGKLLPLTLF